MNAKLLAISTIARSIGITVVAAIALGAGATAGAQNMQIAASLLYNATYNYEAGGYADTNIIFGVTPTLHTGLPPSLSLAALPINPPGPQSFLNFSGISNNGLVYAPSTQPGATVDLVAVSNGSIYRFFGPFSGSSAPASPNTTPFATIWNQCGGEEAEVVRANAVVHSNAASPPSESSGCNGPEQPGAMAIDGNGVLYVLSLDGGSIECDGPVVELWAFLPVAITANTPAGYATQPVLIDNNVAGGGTSNCTARDYSNNNVSQASAQAFFPNPFTVADLVVAPSGVAAPLSANDVLVVFGDSNYNYPAPQNVVAVLADYNASNLAAVIKGTASLNTPLVVANSSDIVHWGQTLTGPAPAAGGGPTWVAGPTDQALSAAAWPADSNILLLDEDGNIFKFTWSTTCAVAKATNCSVVNMPVFWPLLPNAQAESNYYGSLQVNSLRTGAQSGNSYAFVAAYTPGEGPGAPGEILALDNSSGANAPQIASTNDGPFSALAVSSPPSGTGSGAQCVTGCNLSGGNQQLITGTPTAIAAVEALGAKGKITETVCIVQQDPRHICNAHAPLPPSNSLYNSKTLPVSAVCPNSHFNPSFGNTIIPDYICGDYGSGGPGTGTGFVLIQGVANGVDGVPDLLIYNDANADAFFDPGQTEPCTSNQPTTVFGWAPWSGSTTEGSIPESPFMTELTYGCGTSRASSSGMSINMLGGKLSLATANEFKANNTSFAEFKYANLFTDVLVAPIDVIQKVRLESIIVRSELFLTRGQTSCAARKIWRADQYVADHASHFHGIPGFDPNSYGRARSRLANLFLTIFSRIEGNVAPQMWPLPTAPGICPGNIDIDPDGY
ncbi:MAG TPA: hypothetical protein VGF89_07710 [Steroidobacteraceae bacterium]|jgi:hypothetical protein